MRKDFALSPEQKADMREALRLLEGAGSPLKVAEAVRIALAIVPGAGESALVGEAITAFELACIRRKMSAGTLEFYQSHLGRMAEAFGEVKMDTVTRSRLKRWLEGQELAPDTIRGRFRAVRAMWRWAMRQDPPLAHKDPTEGLQLELAKTPTHDRFLTTAEAKKVMGKAGIYASTLACVFFAGMRIEEVRPKRGRKEPLRWRDIDFEERHIRVASGKNAVRIQEGLPENLWAWLEHGRKALESEGHGVGADDPVCPYEVKQAWMVARKALGGWPKNAHRHSFITYHVALHKDTGKTSELIGHEGRVQLLHARYKGRATEAQAREYFGILPQGVNPAPNPAAQPADSHP